MGLFDDAGIDPDDLVTGLNDGVYPAVLSKVYQKDMKFGQGDLTRPNLVFEYDVEGAPFPINQAFAIAPGPINKMDDTDDSYNTYPFGGKTVRQTEQAYWKHQYRKLKMWLISHGVDEKNVNRVDPADLVGTKVQLQVKRSRTGFTNAVGVSVEGAAGTALPTRSASAGTSASGTASGSAASVPTGTGVANTPDGVVNPFRR